MKEKYEKPVVKKVKLKVVGGAGAGASVSNPQKAYLGSV